MQNIIATKENDLNVKNGFTRIIYMMSFKIVKLFIVLKQCVEWNSYEKK